MRDLRGPAAVVRRGIRGLPERVRHDDWRHHTRGTAALEDGRHVARTVRSLLGRVFRSNAEVLGFGIVQRHVSTPFRQAYARPSRRMPTKISMLTKPPRSRSRNTIAQR